MAIPQTLTLISCDGIKISVGWCFVSLAFLMLTIFADARAAFMSRMIENAVGDLGSPGEEAIPIMNVSNHHKHKSGRC